MDETNHPFESELQERQESSTGSVLGLGAWKEKTLQDPHLDWNLEQ